MSEASRRGADAPRKRLQEDDDHDTPKRKKVFDAYENCAIMNNGGYKISYPA
jgi:hypothetical protein